MELDEKATVINLLKTTYVNMNEEHGVRPKKNNVEEMREESDTGTHISGD